MTKNDTARAVEAARKLMADGQSRRAAALTVGLPESTLRYHLKKDDASGRADSAVRGGAEAVAKTQRPDGSGSATSSVKATAVTEEEVLREHGIDPDDVVIPSGRASRWGDPDDPKHQLRVNYERKDALYVLPDPAGWEPPPTPDNWTWDGTDFAPGSFLFITDPHLPYINKPLERAVLRYIVAEQPPLIVVGGDLGDYAVLSKHKKHPKYKAMVSHTHDKITEFLWRLRVAAPDAKIVVLRGNHDDRLPLMVEERAPELAGLRPGALPTDESEPECVYGFRQLWRLDDLGINLVDEDWKLGKFAIADQLTARHGHFTGPGAERKGLEKYGRSQLHGHTHTGQMQYRTKHDPLDIRVSVSSPVMAQLNEDGLGYEPEPDWTPGCTVGYVWDDGDFVLSMAPYINDNLLLPYGQRISGLEDDE